MELQTIVDRIAEGLEYLDANDSGGRVAQRDKQPFLPGVKTMYEREVTTKLAAWWNGKYPSDFGSGGEVRAEVPYPTRRSINCDLVAFGFGGVPVWAIEVKHIALVGDNGKKNDYGVTKMLFTYLKDRSLRHDLVKMRSSDGFKCDGATIVYSFGYSPKTMAEAIYRFPSEVASRIKELDLVRKSVQDVRGTYSITPMIEIANMVLTSEHLVENHAQQSFVAWKHPCGGEGLVAGWSAKR